MPAPHFGGNDWTKLADYNAEVARGIVHTAEYDELMARWQKLFDLEQRNNLVASHSPRRRWWRR